jgi:tetratricopeptide (TPR) repeat protein
MRTEAETSAVEVRRTTVVIPTYEPRPPDKNPMFLEKRVYQGSSGRVYPLPFTDRIAETPRPLEWEAVYIENEYLLVMILPALGGRIHRALDKTNGFDFIYHQHVIKPALVGLAGPWASGGIEFNWPQHHKPSTFMPADVAVERHAGGAMTVWLSEHDPMVRMKGMHGVRLHPGRSHIELVARVYNRTADVQTFLWWANVAVRAHERYQSFFPPDAAFVADHAKRAISTYPMCDGSYYGVDYGSRPTRGVPPDEIPRQFAPLNGQAGKANAGSVASYPPNDLSWYANIPVPTSYMCVASKEDFSGGYDHRAAAGILHIADRHISPGKKQWTWGNSEFGYAWDRNLTDPDENGEYRPYLELMGGVFTDNQPDFSYLQPGETRTWSQFWYPFRQIGPAQKANVNAALSFRVARGIARIGIAVTGRYPGARVRLLRQDKTVGEWTQDLVPGRPLLFETVVGAADRDGHYSVEAVSAEGAAIVAYAPAQVAKEARPTPATEPPPPGEVSSADELYLIGVHLEQYRHATRLPEAYWNEGLRRDPGDARCNLALGRWRLRRGEFQEAEKHLRASIARLVARNPNPYDGESYYQLGRCLRFQALASASKAARLDEAYDAFFKSTWNQAWQAAGYHALAEIDSVRGDWKAALDHLDRALRANQDNLRARNLKAVALARLGRGAESAALVRETLSMDPLDWWARHLAGEKLGCDAQVRMDLAHDYAAAGQFLDALDVLASGDAKEAPPTGTPRGGRGPDLPDGSLGTAPILGYFRAWLCRQIGDGRAERRLLASAARACPDYCFPARLEEISILRSAIETKPRDARAPFYLGNLLYDRRRHEEAIVLWERAVQLDPSNAVGWRNLGIGYFNIRRRRDAAKAAYERAFAADPSDARLLYERDQLWKRLGVAPARRLRQLRRHAPLVRARDDLSVELCSLCNQTGSPRSALRILADRRFQPWEGGEGLALREHVRTHLDLGRQALRQRRPRAALRHFRTALSAPDNLGEANHPLANQADIHYWMGRALAAGGDPEGARKHWTKAARAKGDFQSMSFRTFSETTYFAAASLACLGRKGEARRLCSALLSHARRLRTAPAKVDYFATSLPTMLLFDDDLQRRQVTTSLFLEAQAQVGLGKRARGRILLKEVLRRDPSHPFAADQQD